MMARLSVGSVEPWEVVLSLGLLIATVPSWPGCRSGSTGAGVLLYGQPPTMRTSFGRPRVAGLGGSSSNGRRRKSASTGAVPTASSTESASAPRFGHGVRVGIGPATIERQSALWTPGRYGLVRRRARTPAIPCAVTAAWSARPSPAIAGTTTTSSPGRRMRRRASRRFSRGRSSSHLPSRWRTSNTRSDGSSGVAVQALRSASSWPGRARRRPPARRRARRSARRRGRRARRARAGAAARSGRAGPRSARRRRPPAPTGR